VFHPFGLAEFAHRHDRPDRLCGPATGENPNMRLAGVLRSAASIGAGAVLGLAALPAAAPAQEGVGAVSRIKGDPVAVCGNLAYASNSHSNTLAVIDLKEERLVGNLPTGKAPVNPTFNRDWTRLYVSNSQGGTLTVIDTKTAKVIDTIPAGGPKPSGLRFLPDGRHLVISFLGPKTSDAGSLGMMDLQTGKLIWNIPVQAQSERFDITPDGKRAYVANIVGQTLSVVDLEKGQIIETIPSPERLPFNVLVSPKGLRAFVANVMGNTILEIDTTTNKVVGTIHTAPGPNGMTFTPDGDNILITAVYAGRLQSYNLSAKVVSEGAYVGLLPGFVRLAPDGLKGIFVRPYGRQVSIFDGTTLQVIKNIETGIGPSTVAICGNP
jgi:YVTN family beta-propeller protein